MATAVHAPLPVELPTGETRTLSTPTQLTLELMKTSKGRCGLTLVQRKKSLTVEAVQPGSVSLKPQHDPKSPRATLPLHGT